MKSTPTLIRCQETRSHLTCGKKPRSAWDGSTKKPRLHQVTTPRRGLGAWTGQLLLNPELVDHAFPTGVSQARRHGPRYFNGWHGPMA